MIKLENFNKKVLASVFIFAVLLCTMIPYFAFAADVSYPGYNEVSESGKTASTDVGLKLDEGDQLKFTAPTIINFALNADGTFQVPTGAYIKNESAFKIKVVSFDVESLNGTTGVSSVNGKTDPDTYQVSIKGGNSTAVPFAEDSPDGWAGWILGIGEGNDTCNLVFSDGKMVNVTGSKWINGADLQDVTWTVTANVD